MIRNRPSNSTSLPHLACFADIGFAYPRYQELRVAAGNRRLKLLHYRNFGFHRIGDETLVVRVVMHLVQLLRARLLLARPGNLRV